MELVVDPPRAVLYIGLGLPLAVALIVALTRGPRLHRALALGVVCAVCAAVLYVGYRPLRFGWDRDGLHDAGFAPTVHVAWREVKEATLVRRFRTTGFCPRRRDRGTAYADVRAGLFTLANGMRLRVFLMGESDDALYLRTDRGDLLYAPRGVDALVQALADHGISVVQHEANPSP